MLTWTGVKFDTRDVQTSAADLRYPRKIESRTSVMMLCIALVSCESVNAQNHIVAGTRTYNNAGKMSKEDSAVLVVPAMNLREMCLEIRHDSIILVRAVAIRGDAANNEHPMQSSMTHILTTC